MGSKKKKITVGYRYFMDIQAGLGRGPVNEIVSINADDKIIIAGTAGEISGDKQIYIDKPDLFGGTDTSGEGGIRGWLEIAMGNADQTPSERVKGLLSGLVPGFRGMVTTFFSGMIGAYSASPKPWLYRVRRSTRGWDGGVVWYPEKATIILRNDEATLSDTSLSEEQADNLRTIHAMNGAHILVECATNRDWGRGLGLSQLDLGTYTASADTLFNEAFGLCFRYNRQDNLDTFVQQVLDHIGAVQYGDLQTGKLCLKLIRNDYKPDELPLFNYDNGILSVQDDDASAADIAANEIVLTWHDPVTNTDSEVRAQNLGSIQSGVGLISESVSYKAIPTHSLAARVVERDLEAGAAGLTRLTLRFDRRGGVLTPAACFRLSLEDRGIDNMIMRVGKISENDDGSLTVVVVQDVFGLPATSYSSGQQPSEWTPPDVQPRPVTEQRAIELPYTTLAASVGPADLATLADDAGYTGVMAVQPQSAAINYQLQSNAGAGWTGEQSGDWTPAALLLADADRLSDSLRVVVDGLTGSITPGDGIMINDEILRIDAINNANSTLTVGRGCADTVPQTHKAGSRVWFYDGLIESDMAEYSTGEEVAVRLLTRTAAGTLAPALATPAAVVMQSRQARPYPPADIRANGVQTLTIKHGEAFTLTWAHRNRVIQSNNLVSHDEPSVSPEAGTAYPVRMYKGDSLVRELVMTGSSWNYPDPANPTWEDFDSVTIFARRDGIESRQGYQLDVEG